MRKKLKELQNGCSRTEVFISPKNYKSIRNKSQLPKYWFVECRFYDPVHLSEYPAGFQFRKKFSGEVISELKTMADLYKEEMEYNLDFLNYNPITREFISSDGCDLHPGLLFVEALKVAFEKLKPTFKSANHTKQVRCMIQRIEKVQFLAKLDAVRIIDIRTHHLKHLLDKLNLTNSVYNKFRTYLMALFKELIQYGCVTSNYLRDISKREEISKSRKILTQQRFDLVFNYLREHMPEFFRYAIIFHYSGARSSELTRMRRHDVDLERREFKVLVMKGNRQVWETKAIIPAALPYWQSLVAESIHDDEYLFSYLQCPGDTYVSPRAITQLWRRHIKEGNKILDRDGKPVRIDEDFYSLKHLFLDKLDRMQGLPPVLELAQGAAGHTSSKTTGIYTVGRKNRAVERLKNLKIS